MRRLRWPVGHIVAMVVMAGGGVLAGAVSAAGAGDGIPRPPGAIEHRGYELVSSGGVTDSPVESVSRLATDGDHVLYSVLGGVDGSPTGSRSKLVAARTSSGWVSRNVLPPPLNLIDETYWVAATTPDLSGGIWSTFHGLGTPLQTPGMTIVRLDHSGGQAVLHGFPVLFGANNAEFVASDDLAHVYGNVPETIDPSHLPDTTNVYDFGSGTPALISRMPGSGQAPACGVAQVHNVGATDFGFADSVSAVYQHWTSTDGSRVLFATHGDTCSDPLRLYQRDVAGGITTPISGPPLAGDPEIGVDRFIGATPDGSKVFFRTATSLDPADDADGSNNDLDIYRWTAVGGNVCLTCSVPNADVSPASGSSAVSEHLNVAGSEDGSHVYFTSSNQLGDAPAAADAAAPNIYVWRDDGSSRGVIHFVARGDGIDPLLVGYAGEVTPDGKTLLFRSHQPGLDALSGTPNGGFFEYYRYEDGDGSVTCVSCPPGGSTPTVDVPSVIPLLFSQPILPPSGVVSDDGHTVVFSTDEKLVSADIDNGPDLYEWHDGTIGLITSGTMHYGPGEIPRIVTISPSGRDILFIDFAALTGDVQSGTPRLYDARIDGGFPPAAAPSPPCDGDSCQGAPSVPGALIDPSSQALNGAGNVKLRGIQFVVAHVTSSQRRRLESTGRLTLSIRVNVAGRLSAVAVAGIDGHTRTVARGSESVRRPGTAALTLRLSSAARLQLARSGRLRVALAVRFSNAIAVRRVVLQLSASHRAGAAHAAYVRATANVR